MPSCISIERKGIVSNPQKNDGEPEIAEEEAPDPDEMSESEAPEAPAAPNENSETPEAAPSPFVVAMLALFPPLALFALMDAVGIARGETPVLREQVVMTLKLFAYVLPFFLLVGVAVAGFVAAFARAWRWAADHDLPRLQGDSAGDAMAAALPPLAGLLFLMMVGAFTAATRFNNRTLAALLVAIFAAVILAPLAFLWLVGFASAGFLRRRISPQLASALIWCVAAAPLILVLMWLARVNQEGLKILGPKMMAGPVAALFSLSLLVLFRLPSILARERWGRWAAFAAFPVACGVAAGVETVWRPLPIIAIQGNLWSKILIAAGSSMTDFDKDGYSLFFGGGDCAPFNDQINPGVRDIPGDKIDNNCVNGDALPPPKETAPPWYDDFAKTPARNLIVVTIEALRSDHVSFLGYPRKTTPNIDALAARSIVFRRMYSGSSATMMSIFSLWTARAPSYVQLGPDGRIPTSVPWIPEILQTAGFATSAKLVSYAGFKPPSFNRGFSDYDTTTPVGLKDDAFHGFPSRELIGRATQYIDKNAAGRFFLWAHLVEPHATYERAPDAVNFGDSDVDRYDSEIWTADREFGRLVDYLSSKGLLDSTIIYVTGDHAEGLGEHGVQTHFNSVFDSETRTLGLFFVPGVEPRIVDQAVVHRDVVTTAMNLLNVRRDYDKLRGRNLIPTFRGESVLPDEVFIEIGGFGSRALRHMALVRWPFKLIYTLGTTNFKLYHLEDDPGEIRDVSTRYIGPFAEMKDRMLTHVDGKLQ